MDDSIAGWKFWDQALLFRFWEGGWIRLGFLSFACAWGVFSPLLALCESSVVV